MSWKIWAAALSLGVAVSAADPGAALASDRKDGTALAPGSDIVDLYAWMDNGAARVYLVLNVYPDATTTAVFDPAVLYVIHTSGRSGLVDASPSPEKNIICRFPTGLPAECWVGNVAYAKGGLNRQVTSADQKLLFQAGLRNDPYWAFDTATVGLSGAVAEARKTVTTRVAGTAGTCIAAATPTNIQKAYNGTSTNPVTTPVDSYKGKNVL